MANSSLFNAVLALLQPKKPANFRTFGALIFKLTKYNYTWVKDFSRYQ